MRRRDRGQHEGGARFNSPATSTACNPISLPFCSAAISGADGGADPCADALSPWAATETMCLARDGVRVVQVGAERMRCVFLYRNVAEVERGG